MISGPKQQIFSELEYSGWVYDHHQITELDGYFSSVQAYKEAVKSQLNQGSINREELPNDVMDCQACGLAKCTAQEIASISIEELYENSLEDFEPVSLQVLQQALDAFYLANEHIEMPVPDWKIKVLVDWGGSEEARA